jgi:hypothetical protein
MRKTIKCKRGLHEVLLLNPKTRRTWPKSVIFSLLILNLICFGAASAHARPQIDIDFEDASDADLWTPLAGQWTVTEGEYIGAGPNQDPSCSTIYSSTYLNEFLAKNLEIEVDMTALYGSIDKLVLLRATPDLCSVSEIQINFRSDPYNDVAVVETVNNDGRILQFFPLVQPAGESLHVRIRLVSHHLTVWVNYNTAPLVDQDFDFRIAASGSVGLGVVFSGEVAFDNFSVGSPRGKHTGAQGTHLRFGQVVDPDLELSSSARRK